MNIASADRARRVKELTLELEQLTALRDATVGIPDAKLPPEMSSKAIRRRITLAKVGLRDVADEQARADENAKHARRNRLSQHLEPFRIPPPALLRGRKTSLARRLAEWTPEKDKKWHDRRHGIAARRRARIKGATIGPVRRSDIIARDESTCYLCGKVIPDKDIHIDHIIPLARGGSHTVDNLAVTCSQCNIRKGASLTDKRPKSLLPSPPDQ